RQLSLDAVAGRRCTGLGRARGGADCLAELLVSDLCDLALPDSSGRSALDCAREAGPKARACLRLLESAASAPSAWPPLRLRRLEPARSHGCRDSEPRAWGATCDSALLANNCFGEVEFPGLGNTAQFCRVAQTCSDADISQLLLGCWALSRPSLVLSVHGSDCDKASFKAAWQKGLWKTAAGSGAWIVTDCCSGLARKTGQAARDFCDAYGSDSVRAIGVCSWGRSAGREAATRLSLQIRFASDGDSDGSANSLDPNQHLLLVDCAHRDRGCDCCRTDTSWLFRSRFEALLKDWPTLAAGARDSEPKTASRASVQDSTTAEDPAMTSVPLCSVLVGGSCSTCLTSLNSSMRVTGCPLLIIAGTGGLSDLLAQLLAELDTPVPASPRVGGPERPFSALPAAGGLAAAGGCSAGCGDCVSPWLAPRWRLVLAPAGAPPLVLAPLVAGALAGAPGAGALVLAPLVLAPLVLAPLVLALAPLVLAPCLLRELLVDCRQRMEVFTLDVDSASDLDGRILGCLLNSAGGPGGEAAAGGSFNGERLACGNGFWIGATLPKEKVFGQDRCWRDGQLDSFMLAALRENQVGFVKLFVQQGFRLDRFVTVRLLETLYTEDYCSGNESFHAFRACLDAATGLRLLQSLAGKRYKTPYPTEQPHQHEKHLSARQRSSETAFESRAYGILDICASHDESLARENLVRELPQYGDTPSCPWQLIADSIRFVSHSCCVRSCSPFFGAAELSVRRNGPPGSLSSAASRRRIGSPADYLHRLLAFYSSPLLAYIIFLGLYSYTLLFHFRDETFPFCTLWCLPGSAVQLLKTFGKLLCQYESISGYLSSNVERY
uniref:LSDAT_euk domain-containing protein n=1 Tax=Macrostomum lignano TaxID=282301 RepID=A0A1I8FQZ6_9PLAT